MHLASDSDDAVECGSVVFTTGRLQKLRGEREVLAVARAGVRSVRIYRGSTSEHPVREALWALAFAATGAMVLRSGFATLSWMTMLAGAGICALAAWMVEHLLGHVTRISLETDQGSVRIVADDDLAPEQLLAIRKVLHDRLDWPVVFEF